MSDLVLKLVVNGSNDGAIRALNQVVAQARSAGGALQQLDNQGAFSKTRAGVESISKQLATIQNFALTAVPLSMLGGLAADAVRAADEMKGVEARLRMASRSWEEYGQTLAGVKRIAFDSGTALAANVALVNRIADPVQRMGGLQSDVLAITTAVNNSLRITNATTSEAASTMLQFSQAMGAGVLRGEELNSILENAPRLARAIADGLWVTVGQLKTLGEQGALTSQQVFRALQSQQAVLAEEARKLPVTVGQAWTNAVEGIKVYLAELDKTSGTTTALAGALNTVAKNIPAIADGLSTVATLATVAFGARMVASINASIAAQRAKIAVDQISAQSAVRQAEMELAVAQAVAAKAAAELRAVPTINAYTLVTNEATAALARRAAAERMAAANQAVMAASGALAVARTAATAASVGVLGRAMAGAAVAGRGLMALFGGPLGLAVTAITAAVMAWDHFADKTRKATADVKIPVADLLKQFREFSGKISGPNELEESLVRLRERAAELRDQLLDPGFRKTEIGKQADRDLKALDQEIDQATKRVKQFKDELVPEKGTLGLANLKLGVGGLIDQDSLKALQAFDKIYKSFVDGATTDNGRLAVSALEARAAVDKLLSTAKTPAEFSGVVNRIGEMLKANPGDSTLKSQLETAINGRMQAESKALDALVSGLEARAARTQSLFARASGMALAQFSQAAAIARVAAELRGDTAAGSRVDVGVRNAEVAAAVQASNLEIQAIEQTAARKRQIINEQTAATKQSANTEILDAMRVMNEKVAAFEKEVAAGTKSQEQLRDFRELINKKFIADTASAVSAREQAEADGARRIRQIDADSAQDRAKVVEQLYKSVQAKASDALSQYKTYAQQVIGLDKQIANNRLDTLSAIGQLQRQNMDPKAQVENLRAELQAVARATADAMASGQQDQALELLQRQKALASQIGQARGDGLDPKKQAEEGIAEIGRIGAEADAILQAQRASAATAAQQQLDSYNQLATSLAELGKQMTALNEKSAVKLKPEIEQASLDAAIAKVQAAFANASILVKVQPSTAAAEVIGRAWGGEIPGRSPHARADNILIAATAGEFMVQQPRVREPGALPFLQDFNRYGMSALGRWRPPGYAFGGLIGGSVIDRLRVPSAPALPGAGGGQPLVINLPGGGSVRAIVGPSTKSDTDQALRRAALMFGRK